MDRPSPQRRLESSFTQGLVCIVGMGIGCLAHFFFDQSSLYAEETASLSAMHSITRDELYQHVDVLADNTLEGRNAGSEGGLAAARYIVSQLEKDDVAPANEDKKYFQNFSANYRNILAEIPGTDPELKNERIVIGAHFDHVGYGTQRTSYGPLGYIHNGADDNASGVAAVLELAQALKTHGLPLKRTVVVAFWDGEEQGLLGSKHWLENPTFPLESVKLYLNLDMIGRLRNGRVEVGGTRSGRGMRELIGSRSLSEGLHFDFDWDMRSNSDHWPFFNKKIPVAYLFTGLHDDYHRPSDDIEKLDTMGMQEISRYLFDLVERAANAETLPEYRAEARNESNFTRRVRERPVTSKSPRFGVRFQEISSATTPPDESKSNETSSDSDAKTPSYGVEISSVNPGSPASLAGIQAGDCIYEINGHKIESGPEFLRLLFHSPAKAEMAVKKKTSRDSKQDSEDTKSETQLIEIDLKSEPSRIGISWHYDDADPRGVYLTRVDVGSPAAVAGLKVFDRVYQVHGKSFEGSDGFWKLIQEVLESDAENLDLLVESQGHVRDASLQLKYP